MKVNTVVQTESGGQFEPVRMLELELAAPLPVLSAIDPHTGRCYHRARVLVRLHTRPLGLVDLKLSGEGSAPTDYAPRIWADVGGAINAHLRADGLTGVSSLPSEGLLPERIPICFQEREAFLAQAPFVSVVVCTRDRVEQLTNCLTSLLTLEYPHYEIIVVDNAPATSATYDLMRNQYGHLKQVRYVRENRPGTPWARNCGWQQANGEIIAYTDDDVVADRHWLTELVRGFQIAENVAAVSGLTVPAEIETPSQMWFEEYGSFVRGFRQVVHSLSLHPPELSNSPRYPYSAIKYGATVNIAYRTAALTRIGGFDVVFSQGQDTDAYFRVISEGYTLVYEPTAIIFHFHRRDCTSFLRQTYNYSVTFTAFIAKSLLAHPQHIASLAQWFMLGLTGSISRRLDKTRKQGLPRPKGFSWLQIRGWLYGPFWYLRRQYQVRRQIGY